MDIMARTDKSVRSLIYGILLAVWLSEARCPRHHITADSAEGPLHDSKATRFMESGCELEKRKGKTEFSKSVCLAVLTPEAAPRP